MSAKDPFAGIWNLNPGRSQFRSSHRPTGGTMFWERTPEDYLMRAEGTTYDGKAVQEGLQAFNLDEKEHPVPGAPGLVAIARHPDANTIHVQAKNADQVVGEGSYICIGRRDYAGRCGVRHCRSAEAFPDRRDLGSPMKIEVGERRHSFPKKYGAHPSKCQ